MEQKRTIARLWRDAIAAGRTTPRTSSCAAGVAPDLVAGGRRTGRCLRERPAGARGPQGRRVRPPRDDARRMGALRLRARPDRRDRRSRSTRTARRGRRLHPPPLRERRASSARTRTSARRSSRCGPRRQGSSTSSRSTICPRSPSAAAPTQQAPGGAREAAEAIEEDDLFTYIYTSGTTGPPKGCMISNRNYYAMVAVVDDLDRFMGVATRCCSTSRSRTTSAG